LNSFFLGSLEIAAIQGIYIYFVPFMLFFICLYLPINDLDVKKSFRFFSIVLIVNLGALFYQTFKFYGSPIYPGGIGDNVNAFFSDSHTLANYIYVFSFFFYIKYFYKSEISYLFFSLILFLIAIIPANEKMMVFTAVLYLIIFLKYKVKNISKSLIFFPVLIILIIFVSFNLVERDIPSSVINVDRYQNLLESSSNLGFIKAWPLAFDAATDGPSNLLFGVGSGNYGGIAAAENLAIGKGSKYSKKFYEDIYQNINTIFGAFMVKSNTWSNLFAEYGIIGLSGFCYLFIFIIALLKNINSKIMTKSDALLRSVVFFIFSGIIFQGFFTPYSNWGDPLFTYSAVFFAAYLIRKYNNKNKLNNLIFNKRNL